MSIGAHTLCAVMTPRDLLGARTIVASRSSPCVRTSAARTSLALANAESLRRSYARTTSDESPRRNNADWCSSRINGVAYAGPYRACTTPGRVFQRNESVLTGLSYTYALGRY